MMDVGEINAKHESKVVVQVENIGWKDVEIVGVRSSCGCIGLEGLPLTIEKFSDGFLRFVCRPTEGKDLIESSFDFILFSGDEIRFELRAHCVGE